MIHPIFGLLYHQIPLSRPKYPISRAYDPNQGCLQGPGGQRLRAVVHGGAIPSVAKPQEQA